VGRALAHRLKGQFFRVDGTFIAGTDQFYRRVSHVFEQAEENAPAVIFIDDCDAIFEHGREQGFYRYLLTLLDGLESESAGQVCVIMTAMRLDDLPPALVRSGRIELWLETRLPDAAGRRRMLEKLLEGFPTDFGTIDLEALVHATDGFTGADMGPVVLDGKNLLAYDQVLSRPLRSANHYFGEAISAILANRRRAAGRKTGFALGFQRG
jgi:SpoVK/Ycf46/Vps4 family AAA+-type ATPase